MSDMITNPENVTESVGRDDAITATASPRPWSLFVHEEEVGGDGEISICAENEWIATMNLRRITAKADAALIVDAVNNVPMFDILKSDYKDLMGDVDRLKAERDRIREIVRRLVRVAINDRETLRHINSDTQYATDDDDAIGDALREARAAIGEGVANG